MSDQPAWSGEEITVWVNSSVAPGIYRWDFGDDSPVVEGTFDDECYIMERHTYNLPEGVPFQAYTATLTVQTFDDTASDSVDILVVD